jgi:thiamine biosynthesis lipoprotein
VGIRNPFNRAEHVKALSVTDRGVATSGTAIRGQHIYNPYHPNQPITEIISMTVIGPDVYEADRFATAAFAMGRMGVAFIAGLAATARHSGRSQPYRTVRNPVVGGTLPSVSVR